MKQYANIDAQSLKVRGKFTDQLVTDGGFYSGQFGEVAYKSEIPAISYFYGATVKTNANLYAFDAINTISFDQTDFYITQPEANEVKVELRRDAFGATRTGDTTVNTHATANTVNTTASNFKYYWRYIIPANVLTVGKIMRATILGSSTYNSTGTTINFLTVQLNGKPIMKDTGVAIADSADVAAPRVTEFIFIQSSANTLQVIYKDQMARQVATDFGDLRIGLDVNTLSHSGDIASNPALDRELAFYMTNEKEFIGTIDNYFSKIEYLN